MRRHNNPQSKGSEPERRNPMTPQEKRLYHQIHPLKLFTDISAEVLSLYLFWKRKLLAGLVVLLVPPIIVSALIIKWVDLEAYKQTAFGRYLRAYMTPLVVAVRLLGTVITHLGAWYRRPVLIPLGLVIVLLAWLRGILWPKGPKNLSRQRYDKYAFRR
jgi:hypothetical protein